MRAGGFGPLGRSGLGETRTRVAELWRSGPACRCLGGRERGEGLEWGRPIEIELTKAHLLLWRREERCGCPNCSPGGGERGPSP